LAVFPGSSLRACRAGTNFLSSGAMNVRRIATLLSALTFAACSPSPSKTTTAPAASSTQAAAVPTAPAKSAAPASAAAAGTTTSDSSRLGVDLAAIDNTVAPGDDFFHYANGGWIKRTEIPPDRASTGTGAMLTEVTAKRTADLIAETAKTQSPAGSGARKV